MCLGALKMVVVGGSETMKGMEGGGCEGCGMTGKDAQGWEVWREGARAAGTAE